MERCGESAIRVALIFCLLSYTKKMGCQSLITPFLPNKHINSKRQNTVHHVFSSHPSSHLLVILTQRLRQLAKHAIRRVSSLPTAATTNQSVDKRLLRQMTHHVLPDDHRLVTLIQHKEGWKRRRVNLLDLGDEKVL